MDFTLPADTIQYFFFWLVIWLIVVFIPPGPKAIPTAYRLNFLHGLFSAFFAFLCLLGYCPENFVTMTSMPYMVVDITKNLLNDFYFKVPYYHGNVNDRRMEYFHHFISLIVGFYAEYNYAIICDFKVNPIINIILAESSTPLLIAWRQTNSDILGFLFIINFIGVRIIYQIGFFLPEVVRACNSTFSVVASVLYALMNLYFLYTILKKLYRMAMKFFKKEKKQGKGEEGVGQETLAKKKE